MCGAEAIRKLNEWRQRPAQLGDSRTINSDLWVNKEMMLVGLSASAGDDELEVAFENGMHFFCPKPVETTMLASILMMRRKASSLQAALSDIGKQAVSMNSTRIIAGNPSSQSKAQIKANTGSQPCWDMTVPLPDPRPSGPAVVQIVTYDVSGRAQGVLLRTIQIGAMFNPSRRGLPGRPSLGEDGLIGGIPIDTNWSPDGTES